MSPSSLPSLRGDARRQQLLRTRADDASGLAVAAITEFFFGQGADWAKLEQALSLEDPTRDSPVMVRPSLVAALVCIWTEDYARAARLLDSLRASLLERGQAIGSHIFTHL